MNGPILTKFDMATCLGSPDLQQLKFCAFKTLTLWLIAI